MMHEGYRKYLDILKSKGMKSPMSEKEWMIAVGIKVEELPNLIARKSTTARNVATTLENHVADIGKKVKKNDQSNLLLLLENRLKEKKKAPKPKAEAPPKEPKPRYRPSKIYTDEEIKQRRSERRKAKREESKVHKEPKVNLKAMTPEEKRIHANTLYRLRMEKKRELEGKEGRFLMSNLSAEEQEQHKRMKRKQH